MPIEMWWLWIIVAVIFVIAEIFTAGFFLFWFGVGATVTAVAAFFGLDIIWQWVIFIAVTATLFTVSRPFAERFTHKQPPGIGADRFVGRRGVVLEEIDNIKNTGRIRIDKDEWRADSETDEVIPVGALVEVIRMEGTHAVTRPIKEGV